MTRKLVVLQRIQIGFHRGVVDAQELVSGCHHVDTVLLVYVEANSCTPRFGVDSVSKENGTLSVHVKYTYTPEEGDSAMAGWLFTIPVNNDQIQDCTNFDAVLK